MVKDKRYQEIGGVIIILLSFLILISLISFNINDFNVLSLNGPVNNLIGPVGVYISYYLKLAFGLSSYFSVIITFLMAWMILKNGNIKAITGKIFSLLFLAITSSSMASLFIHKEYVNSGGHIGSYIFQFVRTASGNLGSHLIIIIFNIIALILVGIVSLSSIIESISSENTTLRKLRSKLLNFLSKWEYKEIPHNTIEQDYMKRKGKLPWIIKKKILIYEDNEITGYNPHSMKYLEMRDSILADDESLVIDKRFDDDSINPPSNDIFENDNVIDLKIDDDKYISSDPDEYILPDNEVPYDEEFTQGYEDTDTDAFSSDADSSFANDDIPNIHQCKPNESSGNSEERIFKKININKDYIIPTTFLHTTVPLDSDSWESEIKRNSKLLVNTLNNFGIESTVINVNRGPVITLYELQIAPGIKVNKIAGLSDDIAMALAALRVRIVAPIPGKSAIGVEIPNKKREIVTLGDIIQSDHYKKRKGVLKVALGKDILGKPVIIDLKNLPHLLIAGATGSGKSVCVNSILSSLIYNYNPNFVRFILIDPKMVELQLYNGLPHLLTPVITDPAVAPNALKWLIYEMERRYQLLSDMNTRDIMRYNEKIKLEKKEMETLPFIVTIIDELADLMMVASKEIESYIIRIAQKARAVGIHLVLATQRPSVNIITGIIKANFPARVAFQVAQKTDSRTIIDQNGAEKLLGSGDLLYQAPTSSFPFRVQGAYVSEEETMCIVEHLSSLSQPNYIDIDACLFEEEEKNNMYDDESDELFSEAIKIVEETRKASASFLQRRLSIGYNRAARIIELMEDKGYVGPPQGSKPREVYI
ncbi:DNA translocase FtsK 4TM domain-containing protein [Spirochaetota bacterium]